MAVGIKTGGRKKGTPNKATVEVRESIAIFANQNVTRLQEWLDRIAEDDPAKASDLFVKLLEYHVPKLARTEHSGKISHAFPTSINVNLIKPKD